MPVSNHTIVARTHFDPALVDFLFTDDGGVYIKVHGYDDQDGYLRTDVPKTGGGRRTRKLHRLLLEAFIGPCPKGMVCRHLDGNRKNNKLSNLCWGTPKENSEDREKHGNHCHGEKSGMAKLKEDNIRDVRKLHRLGVSGAEIARIMGVKKETIYLIINGKTWRHVTE